MKPHRLFVFVVLLPGLGFIVRGQSSSLAPLPALGYAVDPQAHSLRPLLGIPGAALIGNTVPAPRLRTAAIGSESNFVIGISADVNNPAVVQIDLRGDGQPSPVAIVGRPVSVFSSPTGASAAVTTADGSVAFITDVQTVPVVRQFSFGIHVDSLAISDDGNLIMAPSGSQLVRLGRDGSMAAFSADAAVNVVAFAANTYDALAAGPDGVLWRIQSAATNLTFSSIAGSDVISKAADLAFTSDGQQAVVANAGNNTIAFIDLQSGQASVVACSCAPSALHALGASTWFRVNEMSAQPLYLIDSATRQFRFIPPVESTSRERRP